MGYPSDPELGWYYVVSVAGEVDGVQYSVGDWIVWNGTSWDRLVGKSESEAVAVGVVLMYDGTGIVNVETRDTQIGDEVGDTIAMPGWFVCNGLAGTPDLEKMFVRGGLVTGVVGGSDDAVVVQHIHPAVQDEHTHGFRERTLGYEPGLEIGKTFSLTSSYDDGYINTKRPNITIGNEGSSGVGKNVPANYAVIYIKKMN